MVPQIIEHSATNFHSSSNFQTVKTSMKSLFLVLVVLTWSLQDSHGFIFPRYMDYPTKALESFKDVNKYIETRNRRSNTNGPQQMSTNGNKKIIPVFDFVNGKVIMKVVPTKNFRFSGFGGK